MPLVEDMDGYKSLAEFAQTAERNAIEEYRKVMEFVVEDLNADTLRIGDIRKQKSDYDWMVEYRPAVW